MDHTTDLMDGIEAAVYELEDSAYDDGVKGKADQTPSKSDRTRSLRRALLLMIRRVYLRKLELEGEVWVKKKIASF